MMLITAVMRKGERMNDLISRQMAIDALRDAENHAFNSYYQGLIKAHKIIADLPPAQPTIYGYNVEHLELIARILQKENMPPEKVVELLTDIGRIGAIISGEFEEALRKAVEQCMI